MRIYKLWFDILIFLTNFLKFQIIKREKDFISNILNDQTVLILKIFKFI